MRSFLPALQSFAKDVELFVVAQDDRYASLCGGGSAATLVRVRPGRFVRGAARVLWDQRSLPRIAQDLAADVIYTATNSGPLFSKIPVVTAVRNMEPLVPIQRGSTFRHAIRHSLLRSLTIASARAATRVVAVSSYVRQTLEQMGVAGHKIDIVYHGVSDLAPTSIQKRDPQTEPFVFATAKFIRYANLETLFRAFACMRTRGYRGRLLLAGGAYDERYERDMRRLVQDLGIEPYVSFLGYIPRDQVCGHMRNADVFLFPSMLEACPFSLLEGMQSGAAIVATTCAPMPEFCGDAALYVAPTDGDGLAAAALQVLQDVDLGDRLRARAQARADQFTWGESVRALAAVWERAACTSSS